MDLPSLHTTLDCVARLCVPYPPIVTGKQEQISKHNIRGKGTRVVEGIRKKFYIYDKDKKRIKTTYVEKDAMKYKEKGYKVTSRRKIKND